MYVQKGQTLIMIMSHHNVWAALQIFPNDQSLVKKGNVVEIFPETDTMAVIKGQVDFIEPIYREGSKTVTVRVYFHNKDMLPIGSHVQANISVKSQPAYWLPQSAVLSMGIDQIAFVKKGDGFIAHKIITGAKAGNDIQVESGISEKDSVLMNASYVMDSESFIKTASK
jgi:Cu(I)/Ag(I) efflux system membrane fusion protein